MEKKIVVFGIGDFSDIVCFVAEHRLGQTISGFTVNEKYVKSDEHKGRPLVPFERLEEYFPPEETDLYLGFISKKMFLDREEVFNSMKERGYRVLNLIHPSASVDTDEIGEGNIILQNCSVEHHCSLGNCNILWANVALPHHNKVGNFNNLAPSISLSGYSSIGNHCYIGNNSTIKNRIHIPDFAFVGAGSYITKPIEEKSVWVPHRSYPLEDKTSFDFF